ncbi:MAG: hypothetical protein AAGA60_13265 [Cyanobacteria bacterium P01_E01_bin.42]
MQTTRANSLDEIYLTLNPDPLETQEEIDAFYRKELNEARGGDKIGRLQLGLERAFKQGIFFKGCLMGHPGVGKSTELTRLIQKVNNKFSVIRFDVRTDLNPSSFNPLDVLLLMMIEVTKKTGMPIAEGGAGKKPSSKMLQEILDWFATEKTIRISAGEAAIAVSAGAGVKEDSLWDKVLGLFASLKGDIKYSHIRKKEITEYRLARTTNLIEVANRLLNECNQYLREVSDRDWLFIGEDFDKAGIPVQSLESLFITYANIFAELDTHLIFNLPISLYSSPKAIQLPFPHEESLIIPDTPVFNEDRSPNAKGRQAIREVLAVRVDPNLFEIDTIERLIVASGGNLRDLFSMTNYAADTAILRESDNGKISNEDVTIAINNMRTEYERRLGGSSDGESEIVYPDKADLMKRIYDGDKDAQIPTRILYMLLNCRAVQDFNGWLGVHPLVVDLLNAQGRIPDGAQGVIPGGTT